MRRTGGRGAGRGPDQRVYALTFRARASSSAWISNSPSSESLSRVWEAPVRRFLSPFFFHGAMAARDRGPGPTRLPAAMRAGHSDPEVGGTCRTHRLRGGGAWEGDARVALRSGTALGTNQLREEPSVYVATPMGRGLRDRQLVGGRPEECTN